MIFFSEMSLMLFVTYRVSLLKPNIYHTNYKLGTLQELLIAFFFFFFFFLNKEIAPFPDIDCLK